MPDSQVHRAMPPSSWSDAFSALPDAVPPADGWGRVAVALDDAPVRHAPRALRPRRWPLWLAAAAAVCAVTLVAPWLLDREPSPVAPGSPVTASRVAGVTTDAVDARPAIRESEGNAVVERGDLARAPGPGPLADVMPAPATPRVRKPVPRRAMARTTPAPTVSAPAPQADELAAADGTPAANAVADANVDPLDALPQLQAESAQLEALVAFARDGRVASASSAVLASDLDARIGLIDAALSQAGVPQVQRSALWQARIDALRELAGVETTQRWLAARGERYDGALVRVD